MANGLLDYLNNQKPLERKGEGNYLRQMFPKIYGAMGGLLGTAPDEFQGSVLDPLTAQVRQGAEMGYLPGLLASGAPPMKGAAGLAGLAGMFVGKGSKTWDAVQATRAMQLEKAGVDARKIWSETGTWKAPDGAWRQEIPDSIADRVNPMKENKPPGWVPSTVGNYTRSKAINAYPDLGDIKIDTEAVYGVDPFGGVKGAYSQADNKMYMQPSGDDGYSTAMHELQHAIQQREGWARGGSPNDPEMFKLGQAALSGEKSSVLEAMNRVPENSPEFLKLRERYGVLTDRGNEIEPNEIYRRLAGEAEARATQARIPLDATARRQLFPADSYDVPLNQLIIRGMTR